MMKIEVEKNKIALIGLGRLQLGLVAPIFSNMDFDIICINFSKQALIDKLNKFNLYKLHLEDKTINEVPIKDAYLFDSTNKNIGNNNKIFDSISNIQILNFALGQEERAVDLAANFLKEYVYYRINNNLNDDVFVTCSDNPKGELFATEEIRNKFMSKTFDMDSSEREKLWNNVSNNIKFIPTISDRICPHRIIPSDENKRVSIISESYGELIFDKSFSSIREVIGDKLSKIKITSSIEKARKRKIYTVNMAHSLAAYLGLCHETKPMHIHEALDIHSIESSVLKALKDVSLAFSISTGDSLDDLKQYTLTTYKRLKNKEINDEISRVAKDVHRKVLKKDRLIGPLLLIYRTLFKICEPIEIAITAAFLYAYQYGDCLEDEEDFTTRVIRDKICQKGIRWVLINISGLNSDDASEKNIIESIAKRFESCLENEENKQDYITALGDSFADYTITDRFKEIHSNLGLKPDLNSTRVNFDESDFKKIIPEELWNDENKAYLTGFLDDIKKYKGMITNEFNREGSFLTVEHYFYFDILKQQKEKIDPYQPLKKRFIEANRDEIKNIVKSYTKSFKEYKNNSSHSLLEDMLLQNVSSNSTDLSQIAIHHDRFLSSNLLIDDREKVLNYIKDVKVDTIHFIIDNSVMELLNDILLAVTLLELKMVSKIKFHVNVLPVFVSDTIKSEYGDDTELIKSEIKNIDKSLYTCIEKLESSGEIEWLPHVVWSMPTYFYDLKEFFNSFILPSDLLIIKGDLNYRRAVGDKLWSHHMSIYKHITYLPCPALLLRTLKSSVVVDLPVRKYMEAKKKDHSWRSNGSNGIIHFVE